MTSVATWRIVSALRLFEDVRDRWAAQIGVEGLEALEAHLGQLVEQRSLGADDLARDG